MKKLIFFFSIVSLFFSCENDDADYRDEYEGTYQTTIAGSITLPEANASFPIYMTGNFSVKKQGDNQISLTFAGETMVVTVDEDGNFTVPSESVSQTEVDPQTGIRITMNLTSSGFGTISGRTLYIRETIAGNATLELNGETEYSNVVGSVAYNGEKK